MIPVHTVAACPVALDECSARSTMLCSRRLDTNYGSMHFAQTARRTLSGRRNQPDSTPAGDVDSQTEDDAVRKDKVTVALRRQVPILHDVSDSKGCTMNLTAAVRVVFDLNRQTIHLES